jgi:hypothetical protein
VKVHSSILTVRALVSAALVVAFATALSLSAPAQAQAISRSQVIKRGEYWVKKRIGYSQSRYYRGYRRDCSGFVSMAWKLGHSYTTGTISKRATRIRVSSLRPGDAVLIPGRHVSLFAGWKNKRSRTYYALEQTTWGSHAKKRVRRVPSRARALRRRGLTAPRRTVASVPASSPTTTGTLPVVSAASVGSAPAAEQQTR